MTAILATAMIAAVLYVAIVAWPRWLEARFGERVHPETETLGLVAFLVAGGWIVAAAAIVLILSAALA